MQLQPIYDLVRTVESLHVIIWDRDSEYLLEEHHHLDEIQALNPWASGMSPRKSTPSPQLGHAFRRSRCSPRRPGLRRVLRGTLGLQLLGVEHPITAKAAIGEGLRIIFEGIGRRFSPGVIHRYRLIFFHQH